MVLKILMCIYYFTVFVVSCTSWATQVLMVTQNLDSQCQSLCQSPTVTGLPKCPLFWGCVGSTYEYYYLYFCVCPLWQVKRKMLLQTDWYHWWAFSLRSQTNHTAYLWMQGGFQVSLWHIPAVMWVSIWLLTQAIGPILSCQGSPDTTTKSTHYNHL